MRVHTYTPTGAHKKPIIDSDDFQATDARIDIKTFKYNSATLTNGEWRVTITRAEYDELKRWFEKEVK